MPAWTLIETRPTCGRIFQRPLDATERSFVWDANFNGTSDTLHPVELRLLNPSEDALFFSDANIIKAWLSTKRRYPLAGATIQALPGMQCATCHPEGADLKAESGGDSSDPHFVIREHDLTALHPNEVIFGQVTCAEDVERRMAEILDGPRPLSDELLAQLYVFRETDPQRKDILHVMTLIAHCVTDALANKAFMRCLLDTLARGGEPGAEPAQVPLEEGWRW